MDYPEVKRWTEEWVQVWLMEYEFEYCSHSNVSLTLISISLPFYFNCLVCCSAYVLELDFRLKVVLCVCEAVRGLYFFILWMCFVVLLSLLFRFLYCECEFWSSFLSFWYLNCFWTNYLPYYYFPHSKAGLLGWRSLCHPWSLTFSSGTNSGNRLISIFFLFFFYCF